MAKSLLFSLVPIFYLSLLKLYTAYSHFISSQSPNAENEMTYDEGVGYPINAFRAGSAHT